MRTPKQTARLAGLLYVGTGLSGAFSVAYFAPAIIARGDAAATAQNIAASPLFYRLAILDDLVAGVFFIWLALTLYDLLKDVDKGQARLMVAFVLAQVSMAFANMLLQLAPLALLNGADYWEPFDKPQLEALALGALTLRSQGIGSLSVYWGLWLLPLGVLVARSRFIPRVIGTLLIVAGVSYIASTVVFVLSPAHYKIVFNFVTVPTAMAELALTSWLLIKGVREVPVSS